MKPALAAVAERIVYVAKVSGAGPSEKIEVIYLSNGQSTTVARRDVLREATITDKLNFSSLHFILFQRIHATKKEKSSSAVHSSTLLESRYKYYYYFL